MTEWLLSFVRASYFGLWENYIYCMTNLGNNTDVTFLLFFPRNVGVRARLFFSIGLLSLTLSYMVALLSCLLQWFVPRKTNLFICEQEATAPQGKWKSSMSQSWYFLLYVIYYFLLKPVHSQIIPSLRCDIQLLSGYQYWRWWGFD